jgi:hypothetical protein
MQSAEHDAPLYSARLAELVYLANVLLAGADASKRIGSLYDAVSLAIETCGAALEHLGDRGSLERLEADKLFRIGWWLRSRPRSNEAVELRK